MHIVVWLPRFNYRQLDTLIGLGATRGLGLHPIHHYYRRRPAFPGLLVGFASLSAQKLVEAAELFGLCITETLRS
jgi:GntR family transcriptional regulator/MocR family aminotransferase